MHVHTLTDLSADQVQERLRASAPQIDYAERRSPPKLFLSGGPPAVPAAAEVMLEPRADGQDVILRLMWGPLPAPFPRAVLGVAVLLAGGALMVQRRGEAALQRQVGAMLDGATFEPRPH